MSLCEVTLANPPKRYSDTCPPIKVYPHHFWQICIPCLDYVPDYTSAVPETFAHTRSSTHFRVLASRLVLSTPKR